MSCLICAFSSVIYSRFAQPIIYIKRSVELKCLFSFIIIFHMMEDTTRLTSEQSIKLFIQRDYSEGTAVKFQERFPAELEGKVNISSYTFYFYSFQVNLD